jgi:hypothetical protein
MKLVYWRADTLEEESEASWRQQQQTSLQLRGFPAFWDMPCKAGDVFQMQGRWCFMIKDTA